MDDIVITDLRFVFNVERTLRASAGKAEIKIFNLNPDHRGQLERLGSVPVVLTAGYEDGVHQIFKGDIRPCTNSYTQPDWITTIKGQDGGTRRRTARTSRSYRPARRWRRCCPHSLRISASVAATSWKPLESGATSGAQTEFIAGTTLAGNAMETLTALCRSVEYEVSVQNGRFSCYRSRTRRIAAPVAADSGLVGTIEKDSKGKDQVPHADDPRPLPGPSRRTTVAHHPVRSLPRDEVRLQGRYARGRDWNVDCEAEPL